MVSSHARGSFRGAGIYLLIKMTHPPLCFSLSVPVGLCWPVRLTRCACATGYCNLNGSGRNVRDRSLMMLVRINCAHEKLVGFPISQTTADNEGPDDVLRDPETVDESCCLPGCDGGPVNGTLRMPNIRRHDHLPLLGDGDRPKDICTRLNVVIAVKLPGVKNDFSFLVADAHFEPYSNHIKRTRGEGMAGLFIG